MKAIRKRGLAVLLALALLSAPVCSPQARAAGTYGATDVPQEAEIFRFLTETLGVNTATACGILANLYDESGFSPTATLLDVNGKTSYGVCQWNGGRFEALQSWCAANALDYTALDSQLRYLQVELAGGESAAWSRMQGIPDTLEGAYTAAYNWAAYFERCWSGYYVPRARKAASTFWLTYHGDGSARALFFDASGGSCAESARAVTAGGVCGGLPTPAWGSNVFLGWYTAREGGERVTADSAVSWSGGRTLYAHWNSAVSFVTRLYTICLGRQPDEAGLQSWVARLSGGALTGAQTAAGFFASAEYRSRNQSDAEFVAALYRALLDRESDAGGCRNWLNHLSAGRSRCWVFSNFCAAAEFASLCAAYGIRAGSVGADAYNMAPLARSSAAVPSAAQAEAFARQLYQACLGREPDAGGLQSWVNYLRSGGTGLGAVSGFAFSAEYAAQNTSDAEYAAMLYRAALGREPDAGGLGTWTGHLAAGRSRRWVLEQFCASAEFRSRCAAQSIASGA